MHLGTQAAPLDLDEQELEQIIAGFRDAVLGRPPKVAVAEIKSQVLGFQNERLRAHTERQERGVLAQAASTPGATTTDSGMVYVELRAGEGGTPVSDSTVRIHYVGTFPDGRVFDSSREREELAEFSVSGVIPCFREGLMRMRAGGHSKIHCPSRIAYGQRGSPPKIPPNSTLSFDIELIEILK